MRSVRSSGRLGVGGREEVSAWEVFAQRGGVNPPCEQNDRQVWKHYGNYFRKRPKTFVGCVFCTLIELT